MTLHEQIAKWADLQIRHQQVEQEIKRLEEQERTMYEELHELAATILPACDNGTPPRAVAIGTGSDVVVIMMGRLQLIAVEVYSSQGVVHAHTDTD